MTTNPLAHALPILPASTLEAMSRQRAVHQELCEVNVLLDEVPLTDTETAAPIEARRLELLAELPIDQRYIHAREIPFVETKRWPKVVEHLGSTSVPVIRRDPRQVIPQPPKVTEADDNTERMWKACTVERLRVYCLDRRNEQRLRGIRKALEVAR